MNYNALLGPPVTISVVSPFSVGGYIVNVNWASAVYPAANRAIFVPFRIAQPMVVTSLNVLNGSAVSGNIDVGLYSEDGTKLISAGSTAQSGTTANQTFDVADTLLGAGLFYMAVAMDNTTGALLSTAFGNVQFHKLFGLAEMATAFPLPAAATLATLSSAYIPYIWITGRTLI